MTIGATNLATNRDNADATSYTTASITPTKDRVVVAVVGHEASSGTANQPTLSGNGLTWTAVETVTSSTPLRRLTMFVAKGSSPSAGAVTIDFAGQTQIGCEWSIFELTGIGGAAATDAIIQHKTGSATGATSVSVTLNNAARDANSRAIFAARHLANEATTERSSWTEIGDTSGGSPARALETQIRTDTFEGTGSASWTTSAAALAIAAELAAVPIIGQAVETDTAQPTTGAHPPHSIGQATETDTAQAVDYRTIRTPPGSGDYWGSADWGAFPWGPTELPFPVSIGHPVIGFEEFPPELPPLEHLIIGPNGAVDQPPVVQDFGADEDVGFATLSGAVEAERVRDQPDLYVDGAQWIVLDAATGIPVAGGDMLAPALGEGRANIKADGWAKRLQRRGERLMYAARGFGSLFVPKNSEPYGGDGRGFYTAGEDGFQVDTNGALRIKVAKGVDITSGDRQGFVADFVGLQPGVRRITGHVHASFSGAKFTIRAATAQDEVGPLAGFVDIVDLEGGGVDHDFDIDLTDPGPVLCIEVVANSTHTTTRPLEVTITNLPIYGIASSDKWTGADVARDIAGRLAFEQDVVDSVFQVLPLDVGADGVPQDALDLASLLSGCFYRVLGLTSGIPLPVLQYAPLGSTRWIIIDPEFTVAPVPLPRYDSALIPYTLSNGVAQGVLEVMADAIGQPALPVSRSYGPISLPDPLPNLDNAKLLGQQILTQVYPQRFGGTATFTRVMDTDGELATAHRVHAQDTFTLPLNGGVTLPSKSLHRDGGGVQVTFDDGVAAVDRIVARRARRIQLRHPQ